MDQPLFSVIIPLYNRADMIVETIGSVLAQTCQNFEIIVVDDGSIDCPRAVIESLGDDRIRLFEQENQGGNVARNTGIDVARGRYVAMLDSDDKFLPHHLHANAQVLAAKPEAIVYSKVIVDRGEDLQFIKPPRAMRTGEVMSEYLMCDHGFVPTITLVLRADIAREIRYLAGLPCGQDTDFAIRLFAADHQFVMLNKPGAVWRDMNDPARVSAAPRALIMSDWLDNIRPLITDKAYFAYRGWYLAKAWAQSGNNFRALTLFGMAALRGCYPLRINLFVFLQIIFVRGGYRRLADFYLRFKKDKVAKG
ncbi:MAG: glycosyltransferase involved in cell wall biosynthesis [Gammaproteobacteria bacterium]|jgi:glycosyltransferase involved in cell wall biosynthesis